mmetsp:Transcript_2948/g.2848  ORF Transcript_2948/g.2848 Transcript_2948/m.2848 type:complete len:120 (-) Transcript_2948:12-371(-)|eukprot:CAMPEP_0197826616 /NCGR_PEP_ID=MMETSP1437-20131217/3556_1 /TAXON_ID=49252 ORGANISM="Eucampia antarctica, Strain CCMP1452" /NCGR_SAMPLE_ID=MMETSP1437 /ASSEMBLY_ACC=CAM_ASM_001096 /LENGTH=119 /DNA_ID=CAMNT_0043427131 /DNA_START=255 /DNA_END=614 /DNA_ORIENTATION=-
MASSVSTNPSTNTGNVTVPVAISEVEETISRIRSHKGVEGVMIMTQEGAIIQSTLSEEQSITHAALLSQLTEKASSLVNILDENDDLTFLRIRSKNREIMVAPDKQFLLVVVQNPNVTE